MRAAITIWIVFFFSLRTFAQSDSLSILLNQYVSGLDSAQVNTGLLIDRIISYTPLRDAAHTSSGWDSDRFIQACMDLNRAQMRGKVLPDSSRLIETIRSASSTHKHPLGILNVEYNSLRFNTLRAKDKDLQATKPQRFLDQGAVRVVCPILYGLDPLVPGKHTFYLDSTLVIHNVQTGVAALKMRMKDPSGREIMPWTRVDKAGISVEIREEGFYDVEIAARFTDKQRSLTRSFFEVLDPGVSRFVPPQPDYCRSCCDEFTVVGPPVDLGAYRTVDPTVPETPIQARGTARIYFADSNCVSRRLTCPLVFIDGFDPTNYRTADLVYAKINSPFVDATGEEIRLADRLRSKGYDIVVFDYEDGGEFLEANALAVVQLLTDLYTRYQTSLKDEFVLSGPSMGALVAQYALAYADHHGIPHHTKTYISFDGPHQGANVPLSLQVLLGYVKGNPAINSIVKIWDRLSSGDIRNSFNFYLTLINGPAARQMIAHHVNSGSVAPRPDMYREIFKRKLAEAGNYPSTCRNVALTNGSTAGGYNAYVQPGSSLLDVSLKGGFLRNLLQIRLDALSDSISGKKGLMQLKTYLLGKKIKKLSIAKSANPQLVRYSYDVSPGSFFGDPLSDSLKTVQSVSRLVQRLKKYGLKLKLDYLNVGKFTFIPSFSSIDYQASMALYSSLEGIPIGKEQGNSPFDEVYISRTATDHVAVNAEIAYWLECIVLGKSDIVVR